MSDTSNNWFWSQAGTTLGPVDIDEIRRLIAAGSIDRKTWVFDPAQGAWAAAEMVPGLVFPAVPPTAPPDAPQSVVYCRFCGASNAPTAPRCVSCARDITMPTSGTTLEPRTSAIICRACVLALPFINIFAVIGPLLVLVLGGKDARNTAEAKAAFNCMLVSLLVCIFAGFVAVFGLLCLVGPIVAGLIGAALAVYLVVAGIMGLLAAADDKPFEYPLIPKIIR